MTSCFKDLGVGVGLRPAHHSLFLEKKPTSVSWVEVISENYMPWKNQRLGRPFQILSKVRENFPVSLHGVSLNIGSSDSLDIDYLKRLKVLIDAIDPAVVSDHLSWTGIEGKNLHDLLPIPYTKEALQLISEKIEQVQSFLGRQILLENPSSYLEFKTSEMSEVDFLTEILAKTNCGLLLDINNIFVSSVNHGFDPIKYLNQIQGQRIGQIHLAGHSQVNGYLIDTHDAPICAEVWDLYRWSVKHFGCKSTMIERDAKIPEWQELESELLKIGDIRNEFKKTC